MCDTTRTLYKGKPSRWTELKKETYMFAFAHWEVHMTRCQRYESFMLASWLSHIGVPEGEKSLWRKWRKEGARDREGLRVCIPSWAAYRKTIFQTFHCHGAWLGEIYSTLPVHICNPDGKPCKAKAPEFVFPKWSQCSSTSDPFVSWLNFQNANLPRLPWSTKVYWILKKLEQCW